MASRSLIGVIIAIPATPGTIIRRQHQNPILLTTTHCRADEPMPGIAATGRRLRVKRYFFSGLIPILSNSPQQRELPRRQPSW